MNPISGTNSAEFKPATSQSNLGGIPNAVEAAAKSKIDSHAEPRPLPLPALEVRYVATSAKFLSALAQLRIRYHAPTAAEEGKIALEAIDGEYWPKQRSNPLIVMGRVVR